MMEPSSDHHRGDFVRVCSIDDARVSENGKGGVNSVEEVHECFDVGLNGEVSRSKFSVDENNGTDLVRSSLDRNVQSRFDREIEEEKVSGEGGVDEFGSINLVVDLEHFSAKGFDSNGVEMIDSFGTNDVRLNVRREENDVELTEKEGEYKVKDLVWAKVKTHPWWPGQIFDPSASSNKGRKHFKKEGFLIVYFGDQTFAWNDAAQIKPFHTNFSNMEKQSNAEAFCHAVDCALDEVSRRVAFGLACSCLSREFYTKIRYQVIANAGIRKESSRIDGGDNFSTVASFKPAEVVQCVQDIAKDFSCGFNRLEVTTVRAQLLAFYRWKEYHQLPPHQIIDGSENMFDDNAELPSIGEQSVVEDEKQSSRSAKLLSRKGKLNAYDSISWKHKKERCLSELMLNGSCSMVPNGESKTKKAGRKRKAFESNGSREKIQHRTDVVAGNNLRKIARKLYESPSLIKKENQGSKMSIVHPPTDEFLSKICMAATNPMDEQYSLKFLVGFFSDFRNYCLKKNSQVGDGKNSVEEKGVEQTEENTHRLEATEANEPQGIQDSYWTDRFIETNLDDRVFSETKPVIIDSSSKTSKDNSATALILKFSNLDSVPSITNLNEIFSRYGHLREMETDVLKKKNCVKVVFERRCDAETAFSSAGKFSIFGPSLVSYYLDYSPTPRKTLTPGKKQNRKDVKSVKAMQFEN